METMDRGHVNLPRVLQGITSTTEDLELTMGSELRFGSLLRTLAATSLGERVLQLGAGSGILTAWLLDGMPADSSLLAVETDQELAGVARRFLGSDSRLNLVGSNVPDALSDAAGTYSLIVATAPEALASSLNLVLDLLDAEGLLVVGGLTDSPDGSGTGPRQAEALAQQLQELDGAQLTVVEWSSGVLLLSRNRKGRA